MDIFVIGMFVVGLILIILGGDKFVDASVVIAKKIGISDIVIGATIVSLGTTMPEILVSTLAGIQGNGDISIGNSLGSIICNTSLIGGLVLVFLPPAVDKKNFTWRAVYFYVLTCFFTVVSIWDLKISQLEGLGLFAFFALYAYISVKQGAGETSQEALDGEGTDENALGKSVITLIITSVMMFMGAQLLVDNGIIIAKGLGVPERVVAVTFIALGTSLPELVTAITAIRKKFTAISVGNIVGANLINYMGVIAIPAIIGSINVSPAVFGTDIPLVAFVMAVFVIPPILTGKMHRLQGFILLATYATYSVMLFAG